MRPRSDSGPDADTILSSSASIGPSLPSRSVVIRHPQDQRQFHPQAPACDQPARMHAKRRLLTFSTRSEDGSKKIARLHTGSCAGGEARRSVAKICMSVDFETAAFPQERDEFAQMLAAGFEGRTCLRC